MTITQSQLDVLAKKSERTGLYLLSGKGSIREQYIEAGLIMPNKIKAISAIDRIKLTENG